MILHKNGATFTFTQNLIHSGAYGPLINSILCQDLKYLELMSGLKSVKF